MFFFFTFQQGSSSSYMPASYPGSVHSSQSDPNKETVLLYIPNPSVGAIIGTGGSTIREMISQSGASIKVGFATNCFFLRHWSCAINKTINPPVMHDRLLNLRVKMSRKTVKSKERLLLSELQSRSGRYALFLYINKKKRRVKQW